MTKKADAFIFQSMDRTGRRPRIHYPNMIHHVMMRGNNRQRIFFGDEYCNRFLEIVSESANKFDHKILAYCLMTNHIHMIVHINEFPLSTVMQNINFRYARWANKQLAHIGHLFQARYRSLEVHHEAYLINLCRYVHLNPVSAGLAKTVDDYKWSSHKNYRLGDAPEWLDVSTISRIIKNKTPLNYHQLIYQKDIDRDEWKPALRLLDSGSLIIDDSIMQNASLSPTANAHNAKKLPTNIIESIVSKNLFIHRDELYTKNKNYGVSKKRALLINYWLKYSDIRLSEIANLFERTQSTLRRQVASITFSASEYFSDMVLKKIDTEIQNELKK